MHSIVKSNKKKVVGSRNYLLVVLAIFLILAVASTGSSEAMLGDVNGDGIIDVRDVVLVQRHVLGKITLTAEQLKAADINGDGLVDARDVALIMQYALGIIKTFTLQVTKVEDLFITAHFGTPWNNINFPAKVSATISDGSKKDVSVKWDDQSNPVYNPNLPGSYVFIGNLINLPSGVSNPDSIKVRAIVTVMNQMSPPACVYQTPPAYVYQQ